MPTNLQISNSTALSQSHGKENASYQVLRDNVSIAEVFGNEFTDYPPVVGDYSFPLLQSLMALQSIQMHPLKALA